MPAEINGFLRALGKVWRGSLVMKFRWPRDVRRRMG